jgi:hypothetical protein
MKITSNKTLPRKLSALLRLAVEDALRVESTPGYKLDMNQWVTPAGQVGREYVNANPDPENCRVCMAGAVMVNRGLARPCKTLHTLPVKMTKETKNRLYSIDSMRRGEFFYAIDLLYRPNRRPNRLSRPHHAACCLASKIVMAQFSNVLGRAPWGAYLRAADVLERAGL